MKKIILILTVSLFCTTNFYAQRTIDFEKMQYDENGFLQDIPDSKLHETDNTNFFNNGTKSPAFGVKSLPEPECLWDYSEHPSNYTQCKEVYYDSDNNTVFTAGQTYDELTFIEFNASNGDVNWEKTVSQTNSGHFPREVEDMAIDGEGNIVVTGRSYYPGSSQIVMVVKFDPTTQDTLWTRHFAGDFSLSVFDCGYGVATDNNNNVIVVSLIQRYYNNEPHQFCGIYKLNSAGELLWMKEVGERYGAGRKVKTDDQGNIFVVGEFIQEMNVDEATVLKLDPDGNILWKNGTSSIYNNPLWAWNLTLSSSGELFVGGLSHPEGTTTGKDFAVAQIDTQDGEFLWVSTPINGGVDSTDICKELVYDEASNAIFAGGFIANETLSNGNLSVDICMARFDAADGTLGWVYEFDGDPVDTYGNDWLKDMVYDPEGYVIATGETYNAVYSYSVPTPIFPTMQDWITVKLDAETGDVFWMSLVGEEDTGTPNDIGPQLGKSVDINSSTGEVFVGGTMFNTDNVMYDYSVMGYSNSANVSCNSGGDAFNCQNEPFVTQGSGTNVSEIEWTTDGDGSFTPNNNEFNSTYIAGVQDIENGGCTLTISVNDIGGSTASDDMYLNIVSNPTCNAGDDAIINENQSYTMQGVATHAGEITWTTDGDGTFNDNSILDAIYTCGPNDIANGGVILHLHTEPISPCEGADDDEMHLGITTGVVDIDNGFTGLFLYPNPSTGTINISFDLPNSQDVKIEIYNIIGELLDSKAYRNESGSFNKNINFSNLTKGMYFIKINSGNTKYSKKIIIK